VRILCLYTPQRDIIANLVLAYKGQKKIYVSTVDGAQGQESDLVILVSTATTLPNFTGDRRRLLVAATRARKQLMIIGVRSILQRMPMWNVLLSTLTSTEYVKFDGTVIEPLRWIAPQLVKEVSKWKKTEIFVWQA